MLIARMVLEAPPRARQLLPAAILLLLTHLRYSSAVGPDHIFGTDLIEWKTFRDLKDRTFRATNTKPICYVFSQPWCGACNKLKGEFAKAKPELLEASKSFVMVSVAGDDNKGFGKEYEPDGGYIPRIMFAEPSRKLRPDIQHPNSPPRYAYYYKDANEVVLGMHKALEALKGKIGQTPNIIEL